MNGAPALWCSALAVMAGSSAFAAGAPVQVSGIYPHLATFSDEGECGTGAVVPWADRLWVVTYGPHSPQGSTDKLYEITPDLQQIIRPESIGGTPANRMIHRESQQLFIGPYAIGRDRHVRVIPYSRMFGRPTGTARHLTDPENSVVYATMEEGLYEVDARTLAVTELWADEQRKEGRHADLPGYHGKGFYSGQGRYVYANNGEHGAEALRRPDVPRACSPSGTARLRPGRSSAATSSRRSPAPAASMEARIPRRSRLDHRLGPSLAHPDGARCWPVARLPAAEGLALLRRRAWLEHRVAAHPRHRRGLAADDDARQLLAYSPGRSPQPTPPA